MNRKHKKRIWLSIAGIIALLLVLVGASEAYFFKTAFVPGDKSVLNKYSTQSKKDPLFEQKRWYEKAKKQKWYIKSNTSNYRLDANYIPASSDKSVVLLHGFSNNKDSMGAYAAMFHKLGYNVLMPDARAHGQSQGKYIGYGWPERYDVRKWIKKLLTKEGKQQKVAIFGVSMGGATTMMTSGIKMPKQVKVYIEDCGYTDVKSEFLHEAGDLYHLPGPVAKTAVNLLGLLCKAKLGFEPADASAVKSLAHNRKPMLFIHGGNDPFVPTKMVYANYKATKGPKELWIAKRATHARSFATYPKEYQQKVGKFLKKYM
ncbi:hypothetical protein FC52_GL001565 [Lactobacillus pasteurii DSM 23907 = CRBIP 24.76]|uniref:Hydrolase of the alpha/beta superfamily n=1 Tax=Lactobacillus pasteurii DSM 23907 = CRBIP 24.76 TaxID=1423790 RepID=I7IYS2_9LACO|nr:alpha/beta hydrolase [Lactobacillus pasteurii]KRK07676.1 hypothetical protein FC52_GL001565 [Lactobacillus pasteurii DSM 23907 = CRBIP 24.76]TDG77684.1 hypothetical protein C5L33_000095 [Lactobacillus pasteurii]CCI84682.1 Hydrolase of the alpha/beta superfamily [Lactobacillus pasteurii DSM 23907 = CRBIP 24.76]